MPPRRFALGADSIPVAFICRLSKVFDGKALERARGSITKAQNFCPRAKMWIQRCVRCILAYVQAQHPRVERELIERILGWCQTRPEYRRFGFLFLFTYVFLLRLPSEALPARKGSGNGQSRLALTDGTLVLLLHRRSVVDTFLSCCSGRGHVRLQEEQAARQQADSQLLVCAVAGALLGM